MKVQLWIEDRETGHIVLTDKPGSVKDTQPAHLLLLDGITLDQLDGCPDFPCVASGDYAVVIFRKTPLTELELDQGGSNGICMPCGEWIVHKSWADYDRAPYGD